MTPERPRLGKARKRAGLAIKQTRKLLSRQGHKIDPAHRAEVQQALDQLVAADQARDVVAIYDTLKVLDQRVEQRMGFLRKSPAREYAESIGLAILIALLLRAFIVEAFTIPSGSMIPTLAVGDFLFVNKLSYGVRMPWIDKMVFQWSTPEPGDVVVFVYPCNPSQDFIKRVVAVPGQVVDVNEHGFVTVDGQPVDEKSMEPFTPERDAEFRGGDRNEACGGFQAGRFEANLTDTTFSTIHCRADDTPAQTSGFHAGEVETWASQTRKDWCKGDPSWPPGTEAYRNLRFPWKVPADHYFVMGDSRGNSSDSRYWGFVPIGNIKGKAMFIWASWDASKPWGKFWEKIRWHRLGRGVHSNP